MTRGWTMASLLLLVAGVIGTGIGWVAAPTQAAHSMLVATLWATTTGIGALLFLMLGHAARTSWFVIIRRHIEGYVLSLVLALIMTLPLLPALSHLYAWIQGGETVPHHVAELLARKRAYLNEPFFLGRAGVYWVLYLLSAAALLAWSRAQERGNPGRYARRMRTLSAPGFFFIGIFGSFWAQDWVMSIDAGFYSTMFGAYILASGFMSGAGMTALSTVLASRSGKLEHHNAEHRQALATVMFASMCGWMWFAFAQFFLVWIAGLPDEIRWYLARSEGSWKWVGTAVLLVHFVVPFFLLLFRAIKRTPWTHAAMGVWFAFANYLLLYWLIMPKLHPQGLAVHWLDATTLALGAGAVMIGPSLWMARTPPLATRDPRYRAALQYEGT